MNGFLSNRQRRLQASNIGPAPGSLPRRIHADLRSCTPSQVKLLAKQVLVPKERRIDVYSPGGTSESRVVTRVGTGPIERPDGYLWCQEFHVEDEPDSYFAVMNVDLGSQLDPHWDLAKPVKLRMDSACVPSLFGDEQCDCRQQKDRALAEILRSSQGVLLHIVGHDGRGHGTASHLSTLLTQTGLGWDTVDAARLILHDDQPTDCRSYAGAVAVLKFIGCTPDLPIETLTNNPAKLAALEMNGYRIQRVPIVVPATPSTARHYRAKMKALRHMDLVPDNSHGVAAGD